MKSSKYFGVTYEKRTQKWVAQLYIANRVRFFGRFETEEEAAAQAENAQVHLQEFFPKPFNGELHFEIVGIDPAIAAVRQKLEEDNAPRYREGGDPETKEQETARLVNKAKNSLAQLNEVAVKLGNLLRSIEVAAAR